MIESVPDLFSAISELERRKQHKLNTHVPTEVEEHNELSFHQSGKTIRLLFGGNQSGKSLSSAVEIAWWARANHPHRETPIGRNREIWVISPEYLLIEKGVYRHLITLLDSHAIKERGPKIPQRRLPSYLVVRGEDGYETQIQFISARGDESSRSKFQAAAVDLIAIDEEIPEDIWEELEARTLVTGGQFIISATLVESYEWICKLEDQAMEGHPDIHLTRLNTAKNPYVDQERLSDLLGKWTTESIEYRIKGKSRRVTGLIFSGFNSDHVCEPFKIPEEWPRWCVLDPGWRTFAVLWGTVSPNGIKYIYREIYAHNTPLYQVAREIMELEGNKLDIELSKSLGHYVWEPKDLDKNYETILVRLIDDTVDSHFETGDSGPLMQLQDRYGIICVPAEKTRQGIEILREWISNKEIKVFDTCVNFLNERKRYRVKNSKAGKNRPEAPDKPIKRDDHLMDCWRFWANENPRFVDRERLLDKPKAMTGAEQIKRILERKEEELYV